MVYAVAFKQLGNRELAEEAVQEAFVRAWRAAESFDCDKEIGPRLATISRRVAIDIHRRERRHQHLHLDNATNESALVLLPMGIEQAYAIWETRQAIDELGEDERRIVELQHRYGFTHQEISKRLGVPIGTVKSRSHRAHRHLAIRLGHLGEPAGTERTEGTIRAAQT